MNTIKKPSNGRLIVELQKNEQISKGGIVFTETLETQTQKTKIVSLGSRLKDKYIIGEHAYILRHSGIDIGFDELCIREDEILYTSKE